VTVIASSMALLGLSACVEIQGGAIELAWTIRSFEGEPASCDLTDPAPDGADRPDITHVRVCWEPLPDGGELWGYCNRDRSADFLCKDSRGVTGFEVATGTTAIWIEPTCADSGPAAAGRFQVPAPIVRDVPNGAVVTLNALLIVAAPDACDRAGAI
jgi:hypothetical protein